MTNRNWLLVLFTAAGLAALACNLGCEGGNGDGGSDEGKEGSLRLAVTTNDVFVYTNIVSGTTNVLACTNAVYACGPFVVAIECVTGDIVVRDFFVDRTDCRIPNPYPRVSCLYENRPSIESEVQSIDIWDITYRRRKPTGFMILIDSILYTWTGEIN